MPKGLVCKWHVLAVRWVWSRRGCLVGIATAEEVQHLPKKLLKWRGRGRSTLTSPSLLLPSLCPVSHGRDGARCCMDKGSWETEFAQVSTPVRQKGGAVNESEHNQASCPSFCLLVSCNPELCSDTEGSKLGEACVDKEMAGGKAGRGKPLLCLLLVYLCWLIWAWGAKSSYLDIYF